MILCLRTMTASLGPQRSTVPWAELPFPCDALTAAVLTDSVRSSGPHQLPRNSEVQHRRAFLKCCQDNTVLLDVNQYNIKKRKHSCRSKKLGKRYVKWPSPFRFSRSRFPERVDTATSVGLQGTRCSMFATRPRAPGWGPDCDQGCRWTRPDHRLQQQQQKWGALAFAPQFTQEEAFKMLPLLVHRNGWEKPRFLWFS